MDKHWRNLLITDPQSRRKGNTAASAAHGDRILTREEREGCEYRDKQMGEAFCSRARVAIANFQGY